jgi:hypothetical protein
MNVWYGVTDSDTFRWVVKRGPSRAIFRSAGFQRMNLARNRVATGLAVRWHPTRFSHVRTFCFFIGHLKSGTSLLGGLLDAHRDVILSDELDALRFVEAGFSRDQLFHLILKRARAEARKHRITARRLQAYSFEVPGQWQGRSETPLVVGDGRAGPTTQRLGTSPDLLERLEEALGQLDLRVIHVVRNPFDPISASIVRGQRSFADAIDHYIKRCDVLEGLRDRLDATNMLAVRYEDVVADPETRLAEICRFLGVEADPAYLRASCAIVRPNPDRTRDTVEWTEPWISAVEERIAGYDFLKGYAFQQEVRA